VTLGFYGNYFLLLLKNILVMALLVLVMLALTAQEE